MSTPPAQPTGTPTPSPAAAPSPAPDASAPPSAHVDPDMGFPANTPTAEMTTEQQVAYWKHQSRKHERAENEHRTALDRATTQIQEMQAQTMTDTERALADAREQGRQAALAEATPRMVTAAIKGHAKARHLTDEQTQTLLANINAAALLNDAGEVDDTKVSALVDLITPAEPQHQGLYTLGQGPREPIKHTDREAGLAEAQRRFGDRSKGS